MAPDYLNLDYYLTAILLLLQLPALICSAIPAPFNQLIAVGRVARIIQRAACGLAPDLVRTILLQINPPALVIGAGWRPLI